MCSINHCGVSGRFLSPGVRGPGNDLGDCGYGDESEAETIEQEDRKRVTPGDTAVFGDLLPIKRSQAPFYALVLGLVAGAPVRSSYVVFTNRPVSESKRYRLLRMN